MDQMIAIAQRAKSQGGFGGQMVVAAHVYVHLIMLGRDDAPFFVRRSGLRFDLGDGVGHVPDALLLTQRIHVDERHFLGSHRRNGPFRPHQKAHLGMLMRVQQRDKRAGAGRIVEFAEYFRLEVWNVGAE